MAKTFAYWIILVGTEPTAFRAREREDLVPTLKQLQRTQPGSTLKWFERGRTWNSPEHAEEAKQSRLQNSRGRGPAWRPGGRHADPRERYQVPRDVKRARFKKRLVTERIRSAGPATSGARKKPKP